MSKRRGPRVTERTPRRKTISHKTWNIDYVAPSERFCKTSEKLTYSNRKKALTAMNGQRTAAKTRAALGIADTSMPVAVYHCPHCHGWHMTSSQPRGATR